MLGTKILNLRKEKNLNQYDIADILNISRSTYSMWESKNDLFPTKRLIDLCNYFNVSLDYLLDFTDIKTYKKTNPTLDLKLSGQRLKEFRKENKLTQDKLAKQLNIASTMIVEYEHGRYIISLSTLYGICSKYNLSADYLLGRINTPKYLN